MFDFLIRSHMLSHCWYHVSQVRHVGTDLFVILAGFIDFFFQPFNQKLLVLFSVLSVVTSCCFFSFGFCFLSKTLFLFYRYGIFLTISILIQTLKKFSEVPWILFIFSGVSSVCSSLSFSLFVLLNLLLKSLVILCLSAFTCEKRTRLVKYIPVQLPWASSPGIWIFP